MSIISCIKSLIKRAKTTSNANDSGIAMKTQVQYMNKVSFTEVINPSGFSNSPMPQSLTLLFNVNGTEDNLCGIVTDQLNRIKNLIPGETVLYNTDTKANIYFDSLGNANLNPGDPIGVFNVNYPLSIFNGDVIFANIPPNQVLISGASPAYGIPLNNGEILIGSTGAAPVATTISAGPGVTITNLPGQIIISASGGIITPLPIVDGGTGAITAAGARVNLGLGSMAVQDANSVVINGGSIENLTALNVSSLGLGVVHSNVLGDFSSSLIINADISPSAGIVDTKLATISTVGKVSNSATTATSLNSPNTIVARDGLGDFSAGLITATFTGSLAGTFNGTVGAITPNTGSFTTLTSSGTNTFAQLNTIGVVHNNASGVLSTSLIVNADVSASAGIVDTKLATISTPGKVSNSATTATSLNTANTIVLRGASGEFRAGNVSASGLSLDNTNFLTGILRSGTFIPTLLDTSGDQPIYTSQVGKFTVYGNMVSVSAYIKISAKGLVTAADAIRIGGLPYTPISGFDDVGTAGFTTGSINFPGNARFVTLKSNNGLNYLSILWNRNNNVVDNILWSEATVTFGIYFSISYFI